jgi:hypothetical protein
VVLKDGKLAFEFDTSAPPPSAAKPTVEPEAEAEEPALAE